MTAGKTTRACQEATSFAVFGLRTAYVNNNHDMFRKSAGGSTGKFSSHNPSNIHLCDEVDVHICNRLSDVNLLIYEAVVIDEGQFFEDLVEVVTQLVEAGTMVQVYSLQGTFERKRFGNAIYLIPNADVFEQMTAKCMDCFIDPNLGFQKAAFSRRDTDETGLIEIGGIDKYSATCRKHHFKAIREQITIPGVEIDHIDNQWNDKLHEMLSTVYSLDESSKRRGPIITDIGQSIGITYREDKPVVINTLIDDNKIIEEHWNKTPQNVTYPCTCVCHNICLTNIPHEQCCSCGARIYNTNQNNDEFIHHVSDTGRFEYRCNVCSKHGHTCQFVQLYINDDNFKYRCKACNESEIN
jgi:thymidine kinase